MSACSKLGDIKTFSMFGGVALCIDKTMVGMTFNNIFFVKAHGLIADRIIKEGAIPFIYNKNRKIVTCFYQLPEVYQQSEVRIHTLLIDVLNTARQSKIDNQNTKLEIRNLPNMRRSTETLLNRVGIFTVDEFREVGAVRAYILIRDELKLDVSERLLYRLEGALLKQHWLFLSRNKLQTLQEQCITID